MAKKVKSCLENELPNELPIDSCSRTISLEDFGEFCSYIEGELLTIAEASIDSDKIEAFKSLIKKSIRSNQNIVSDWHWKQGNGNGNNFPFPKVKY